MLLNPVSPVGGTLLTINNNHVEKERRWKKNGEAQNALHSLGNRRLRRRRKAKRASAANLERLQLDRGVGTMPDPGTRDKKGGSENRTGVLAERKLIGKGKRPGLPLLNQTEYTCKKR